MHLGLFAGVMAAGAGSVAWDGRDAAGRVTPAGLYFVVLRGEGRNDRAKTIRLP